MNSSSGADHHDDTVEDEEEVFLDESDIIQEIPVDEEELPDADDDGGSDAEGPDEPDDSIHIFTGHTDQPFDTFFSKDVIRCEIDIGIYVTWSRHFDGEFVCPHDTDELYTVACSPTDPNLVATGGGDDRGFLWNIGQGDWACELTGHTDSISSLGFSSDGKFLASGSFDGLVKVWDISTQKVKFTFDGPGGIEWVKWHPRGHLVLAGSEDSTVWMWNADKGVFLNMFAGHNSTVSCGDFTPDGRTICTGSDDATLRIWNPKSGEIIHVVKGHNYHTEGLTCLSLSSNSTLALTGSKDSSVHLVNITTGQVVGSLSDHSDSIECVGFASSSSPWAATGGMDQKLVVWDLQHLTSRCTCEHEEGVASLAWLGTSRYLATGSVDGKVRIWDSLSGDCVRTLSGHEHGIQSLAVSANGDFLVSVSLDNTARVFEITGFK